MTSPQPAPAPDPADNPQVVLTITALLAAGYTAKALTPRLTALLAPLGISPVAVTAAVLLALSRPASRASRRTALRVATTPTGAAAGRQVSAETAMRARYLLAAAGRLTGAVGRREEFGQAVAAERRFLQQHLDAQARRLTAAGRVDLAARNYGKVLGWHSQRDGRVTPDCAALDGANFTADRKPAAGWPGALHGGTCRCYAGPAHATRRQVP